jgi:tyrosine-protein phosphatase SIW14
MRKALLFLTAVVFALLYAGAGLAQTSQVTEASALHSSFGEKLRVPGIPNAGKISEELFRGAQPRSDGFAQLKKIGITTIVDLRRNDRSKIEWERQHAESLGIHFLNIPVGGWSPPTDAQVAQFLALFRDGAHQKIFVHCHFGDDRTGVFVAAYRVAHDHWPVESAVQEMHFFGFHAFWHPSMETYVRIFPAHLETAPVLRPFDTVQAPAATNHH